MSVGLPLSLTSLLPLSADEIAFLEGMTIVYKSSIDLFIYVVGSAQENEVRSIQCNNSQALEDTHTSRSSAYFLSCLKSAVQFPESLCILANVLWIHMLPHCIDDAIWSQSLCISEWETHPYPT